MKTKYTHKFIVYNKKRIKNNYKGLVEKLADFDKEPIPKSLLENLNDLSELFLKKRQEFYLKNPSKLCTIDEILPYREETNVETNKVLAFVNKYDEFKTYMLTLPKEEIFNAGFEIDLKSYLASYLQSDDSPIKQSTIDNLASIVPLLTIGMV